MITQEMKDKGISCKGKGFNCPTCKDKNSCVDFVSVNGAIQATVFENNVFTLSEALIDMENVIKNEGNLEVDRIIITKDEFKVVMNHQLYDVFDYKN